MTKQAYNVSCDSDSELALSLSSLSSPRTEGSQRERRLLGHSHDTTRSRATADVLRYSHLQEQGPSLARTLAT